MAWDDFEVKNNSGNNGEGKKDQGITPPPIKLPDLKFLKGVPIYGIVLIPLILWFVVGGFYTVQQDEVGIVLRLGRINRSTESGLHFKFPPPFESVYTPKITTVKRVEIGFRIESAGPPARYSDIPAESIMLTGDENIADVDVIVQYKILKAEDYLFNVSKQEDTLHIAAEAAVREVIGAHSIDDALTEGKSQIEDEIRILLQQTMDKYSSGLLITAIKLQDVHPPEEVKSAFKDVASAREDMNRLINEAQGYKNTVIPNARGEASKIINEAQGYKEEKINHAKGDANRFTALLKEYRKAQGVTRERLYLEAMEEVLKDADKYIVPEKGGTIPLLHLGDKDMNKVKP
ncbi:MAG: FtsH protease activity modulator HflK [Nitrospinota bacterium]|nr:FtsH protease activity modulator HflK [Nitrospinota bacterium]